MHVAVASITFESTFSFFYCPFLSSIHEKANYIAAFWTGCPHSLPVAISEAYGPPVFLIKVAASR